MLDLWLLLNDYATVPIQGERAVQRMWSEGGELEEGIAILTYKTVSWKNNN